MLKISKIAVPGVAEPYDIGTLSIPFGQVDSTSTDTAYTAQIEGITSLYDGVCVYLKNGVITSNKNGFTLNINGLGAKPVYGTLAAATRSGTVFNVDYTMLFVYNSSRVSGGCWDIFYGYNSDTTDLEEALTPLTGTTGTLTPMQVYNAIKSGKSVILQYMDDTYGLLSYTNFNVAESMNVIAADTIVYFNNTYVLAELWGDTTRNVWGFETTTLAQKQDIPTKLPNPNALTFTGAVTGSYDGSEPLTVNIPEGGGGTGGSSGLETAAEAQLATGTITPVETTTYTPTGVTLGDLRKYRRFMFVWDGASNTGASNMLLQFSNANLYAMDIARWNEGGMVCVFEWCDAEKTLLRTCAASGGNPSMVPTVGSLYIRYGSYNRSTAGVMFGTEGITLFSTKLAGLNDSSELFIVNASKITIDYQWEIRGVTI